MKLSLALLGCLALLSPLLSPLLHAQENAQKTESEEGMDIRYLHVMLGQLDAEDSWTIEDENGDKVSADRDDMIYGGVFAQLSSSGGKFQYGLESGGLISFKNDTSYFIRSNGGATGRIKVKNQLWVLDMSLGGFVSFRPWRGFRASSSLLRDMINGVIEGKKSVLRTPAPWLGSTGYHPTR